MSDLDQAAQRALLESLRHEPVETEWLEFKTNYGVGVTADDLTGIGRRTAALANAAVLSERTTAYFVWGISDDDHSIVGTSFNPLRAKKGNEDFEPWLTHQLSPQVPLKFTQVDCDGKIVWIMAVGVATTLPVAFSGVRYIRVGSHTKKLSDCPEHERRLWKALEHERFEPGIAREGLREPNVLEILDYVSYFRLLGAPVPESLHGVIEHLAADRLITEEHGRFSVTNLGAILFARDLREFPSLDRKRVRVIRYRGTGRLETEREYVSQSGYAVGFENLVATISQFCPQNEVITHDLRREQSLYPPIAVRELVANMLIHQDFFISGTGPMVEIMDDRMEITNPGNPIIEPLRFIDLPPRSRNESLASMMRRVGVCEERGSGWDKIAFQIEFFQLPAPKVDTPRDSTRAVLYAPEPLTRMDREARVRAVYLHACLNQVLGKMTTNASVRERFGIKDGNSSQASRLINEAIGDGLLAVRDPEAGYRRRSYEPFWAQQE